MYNLSIYNPFCVPHIYTHIHKFIFKKTHHFIYNYVLQPESSTCANNHHRIWITFNVSLEVADILKHKDEIHNISFAVKTALSETSDCQLLCVKYQLFPKADL